MQEIIFKSTFFKLWPEESAVILQIESLDFLPASFIKLPLLNVLVI